jgi:hypothetical protein
MTAATMNKYVIHTIGQTYTAETLLSACEWIEANRNGVAVWITRAKETDAGYEYDESAPIIRKWEATAPMMRSVSTAYHPYDR